ncbi:hypothetical protein GCM10009753_23510 [Streptantibioticus ferralitis]
MRSVSRTLLGHEWHKTTLVTTGLSLGAVGGFVGSLLKERRALAAARKAATAHPANDVEDPLSARRVAAQRCTSSGSAGRPVEMRA